jgi:hypothetical protein
MATEAASPPAQAAEPSTPATAGEPVEPNEQGNTAPAPEETPTAPGSTTTPQLPESVRIGRGSGAVGVEDYHKAKSDALKPQPNGSAPAQPPAATQPDGAATPATTTPTQEQSAAAATPPAEETTATATPAATAAVPATPEEHVEAPDRIRIGGLDATERALVTAAVVMAREKKIPFEQAWDRVNGKPAGTTQPGTAPGQAPAAATTATPEPVKSASGKTEQEIKDSIAAKKAEKREAGKSMDTDKMVDIDDEIDVLRDELNQVQRATERAQAEASQAEEVEFQRQVDTNSRTAVTLYPAAEVKDKPGKIDWTSPLGKKTIEISQRLEKQGNPLPFQPDATLRIMQMAANELGIAPIDPDAPPAAPATPTAANSPSTSTATKPQPVRQTAVVRPMQPAASPASGAARTTQNGNGKNGVDVDNIRSVGDYEATKAKLLPARR